MDVTECIGRVGNDRLKELAKELFQEAERAGLLVENDDHGYSMFMFRYNNNITLDFLNGGDKNYHVKYKLDSPSNT